MASRAAAAKASQRSDPPRRRGRPPSPEIAERRRRELVEAAYQVFTTRGYLAAGIADIAEELGIGHGTFYRYFESKRDILDHVIDYGVERITDAARGDALPGTATTLDELIDQLQEISDRLIALLDREPGLGQILFLEATAVDEELTHRILGLVDTTAALTAEYIESGIDAGFIRRDLDVMAASHALNAAFLPVLAGTLRGTLAGRQRRALQHGLIDFIRSALEVRKS